MPVVSLTPKQLTAIVSTAVVAAMSRVNSGTEAQRGDISNTGTITLGNSLKPRDVGYFDPDPDAKAIETKESKTIYHNVFSFTNQLHVKAIPENAIFLRKNLNTCLLGKADRWYTEELDHLVRSGLCNDPDGVTEWCSALERRFREAPGKLLAYLESLRYTVRDARNCKDPEEYIQQIVVNGKNAWTATMEYSQVLTAYCTSMQSFKSHYLCQQRILKLRHFWCI